VFPVLDPDKSGIIVTWERRDDDAVMFDTAKETPP